MIGRSSPSGESRIQRPPSTRNAGDCRQPFPRRFPRRRSAGISGSVSVRWLILLAGTGVLVASPVAAQGTRPGVASQPPRVGDTGARQEGAGRKTPDSLRFANGLLRQRKFDLAAEEYERFLADRPGRADRADALFGLANARLNQERYPEALRAFGEFLEAAPGDPRTRTARYRLGELSYLVGDLPASRRALEAFTAGAGEHPALETAWTYLGDVCFAQDDLPAARTAYRRALADYPRGRLADRARYGLGRTLAATGEREPALRLFRELAARGGAEWVDRAWLQVATIELAAGRPAAALEALGALEQHAPKGALRAEARLRRARALDALGQTEEAGRMLGELAADSTSPVSAQAALELATGELRRNHPEAALATLQPLLDRGQKSPLRPALLFRSAEALRQLGRLHEAQARFLRVVDEAPDDPWAADALHRAAALALEHEDAAAARRLAGQFASRFPKSPLGNDVRLIEARAAVLAGDHKHAAERLEEMLRPVEASRGEMPSPGPLTPRQTQEARYELALAYRALGRQGDADRLLSTLADEPAAGPAASDARFLLGQAHVEAGRYSQAITPLERYLADNPRGDVAEFALADLVAARVGLGQADDAGKTLDRLAREFPSSKALPRARLRVAEADLAGGRFAAAAEGFKRVLGPAAPAAGAGPSGGTPAGPAAPLEPALRARALTGLGRSLEGLGRPADAAAAFASALEVSPGDPSAPTLALDRARALEASNRPEDALAAYSDAAARFAGRAEAPRAALARARLLARLGRHEDAASAYARLISDRAAVDALARDGATVDVLLAEQGWALVDAARPVDADRVFQRLLADHPASPHAAEARFNLAESANQARNYAEVVRLLAPVFAAAGERKDAAKSPGDATDRLMPAILYRLGRSQVELRDWTAAAATLDRLLVRFPDNPYLREARFLRAEASLQLGDAAAAEPIFTALLAEPGRADDPPGFRQTVRREQFRSWVELKRWKDLAPAAEAYRRDLKPDDPTAAEVDYDLGQAQMGLGRVEDARKTFQAVIDAGHGGELAAQAQLMRGESYFHESRWREALREFLRVDVLYRAPRWQAAALLEAGKVYERLGQWADAAETYDGIMARFPRDPAAAEARTRRESIRKPSASQSPAQRPSAAAPPDGGPP